MIMEYQKIINLLDNITNKSSKFKTKDWIEMNDQTRGTYNANSDIRFKTTMLESSSCDYSDAYICVKGTITIAVREADGRGTSVIFKNCAPFINCKSEINNIEIDNVKTLR